jgi:hypothetical protein
MGDWYDTDSLFDRRAETTWRMVTSSTPGQLEGATQTHPGFRKALRQIVKAYPEIESFSVVFDGPPVSVRQLSKSGPSSLDWRKMVLYHGTSGEAYEAISRQGLRPRRQTGMGAVYGTVGASASQGRTDAVYLTNQIGTARMAALQAAKMHGGDPVVLAVRGLDPGRVLPDEDSGEDTAERSLHRIGAIAYRGSIPPEEITLLEYKDRGAWVRVNEVVA